LRQLRFFRKRYLFKIFRFKRLRAKTFFFKNVKEYLFIKHSRQHCTVLRQNFRKKRPTRRLYPRKTRSGRIFSKIASLRVRAVNYHLKALIKDLRLLTTPIPVNYKTRNLTKSLVIKQVYLKFASIVSYTHFNKINYNYKRKFSFVRKSSSTKKTLYSMSQINNRSNTNVRKQKIRLKTSRLLRKRVSPPTLTGVSFKKYKNPNHVTNLNPQFLYNKGGLFCTNYFKVKTSLVCGLGPVLRQYLTIT
jgi:hypothetical protein